MVISIDCPVQMDQLALTPGEEIMPALPDLFNVSLEVGN
jgi:hypothetical protein